MESSNLNVCIIAAQWNEHVVSRLIDGAKRACEHRGMNANAVHVTRVAGALEIPHALNIAMQNPHFDTFVVLGTVLKGETDHYEHVARMANDGVQKVALRHNKPLGNSILTVHTLELAMARASEGDNNSGYAATLAAIDLFEAMRGLEQYEPPTFKFRAIV
jgi:6,7-dimethyl-8-ribityllumazine synthase